MTFGLAGVSVRFGSTVALDGVDLQLAPGELTALVGSDGAGKTTCARVIVGLTQPDAGRVSRPKRGRIGYQPEAGGSWLDLTVSENLDFVATAHGLGARSRARTEEMLDVTKLSEARDRLAGRLSGGMRQKLAVIMATIAEPELVVLDEPTTGLDPISRGDVWRLLLHAASEGAAVLVTSTYLDEAERSSSITVLDEGQVLVSGTARTIKASLRGSIYVASERPATGHTWRRGRTWRIWSTAGQVPAGARRVDPDVEDVVTAAALARRERTRP